MDPDAMLETMRSLLADHLAGEVPADGAPDHLDALAESVRALDDWLAAGGYLPGGWDRAVPRHIYEVVARAPRPTSEQMETLRRLLPPPKEG
jgi:hypothetical protein